MNSDTTAVVGSKLVISSNRIGPMSTILTTTSPTMQSPKAVRAFVILEAVRFTSEGNINALEQLLSPNPLKLEHVLRILLTFLPEGLNPETYVGLLQELSRHTTPCKPESISFVPQIISESEACRRVQNIRLLPLQLPQYNTTNFDPLTSFLMHQALRIETATGSLHLVTELLQPFLNHSEDLRTWMISTLLPILRLTYEYYPHSTQHTSLNTFASLEDEDALQLVLSRTFRIAKGERDHGLGRDLRGLVGPRMFGQGSRKRQKLNVKGKALEVLQPNENYEYAVKSGWPCVYEQILEVASESFEEAVDAFLQWDGPGDVDYGEWDYEPGKNQDIQKEEYAQVGIAITYATEASSTDAQTKIHLVLKKVANLIRLRQPRDYTESRSPAFDKEISELLTKASVPDLLHDQLLRQNNILTEPKERSVELLNLLLSSSYHLALFQNPTSVRGVLQFCLVSSEEEQSLKFQEIVHRLQADMKGQNQADGWISARNHLLWLHDWGTDLTPAKGRHSGFFSLLDRHEIERGILRGIIDGDACTTAIEVYCQGSQTPLPQSVVSKIALESAFAAYDAASNGNRTRGGVRRASQIVSAFRMVFPKSKELCQLDALLAATHAMSFYSLSLQHQLPFQPVNIRVSKDPIALLSKILEQNRQSYTKLDDLLSIGKNLVLARLLPLDADTDDRDIDDMRREQEIETQRRITRMAIDAALKEDDFGTAYSYVVNRLATNQQIDSSSPPKRDDISWKAAYAAGRYIPDRGSQSALRLLEQRMELLSQAILLAPPSALREILHVWQECEQQLVALNTSEDTEDDVWDQQGDQKIPGSFSVKSNLQGSKDRHHISSTVQEEAPMGLFEVARGAATALSKNAFPLRGNARPPKSPNMEEDLAEEGQQTVDADGSKRLRKRDMVSNMVTGGLVSGIGWVIGEMSCHSQIQFRFAKHVFRCSSNQLRMRALEKDDWRSELERMQTLVESS